MPSPFPGMNPYLEQPGVWPNFHTQVLTAFVAQLVPQVVPNDVVQFGEHISSRGCPNNIPGAVLSKTPHGFEHEISHLVHPASGN